MCTFFMTMALRLGNPRRFTLRQFLLKLSKALKQPLAIVAVMSASQLVRLVALAMFAMGVAKIALTACVIAFALYLSWHYACTQGAFGLPCLFQLYVYFHISRYI